MCDHPGTPASDQFSLAKKEAEAWFDHLDGGGSRQASTVKQVCERYAKDKPDIAGRFKRWVYKEPIAKVAIQKLTKEQVRKWRQRLEAAPAQVTRSKGGQQRVRLDEATKDLYCAIRTAYMLLADCRRRLDLPHFPPPG